MNRKWLGMGLVAVVGVGIGFGLGSAVGQQQGPAMPPGVDAQVVATVDAGADFPGQILRLRKVTFAPGATIAMHSHKERPEVAYVLEGTLTDMRKGAAATQINAGQGEANGREIEHMVENRTGKPVVLIGVDFIKK
jgi:quercetin dioxygenase-like cupin family protein